MDLKSRLLEIERRLSTIETVSRLRSASISEGVTEFVGEGTLTVEEGGSFKIADGGAISGASWEMGVNPDGTTYANVGDVLLRTHDADPVTEYITLGSIPAPITDPVTRIRQEIPEGAQYAVVVGSVNVMADDELRTVVRVRSEDTDISMVVLEGQTQSIPVIMKFEGEIAFEIHATKAYDIDSHFEVVYSWEVVPDESEEQFPAEPSA